MMMEGTHGGEHIFLWECEQIDTLPATIGSFSGIDEEDAWI